MELETCFELLLNILTLNYKLQLGMIVPMASFSIGFCLYTVRLKFL